MTEETKREETRSVPDDPALAAAARAQPGGWVVDLDWIYPDDQRVPPEAIRGAWQVDADGALTGLYRHNERHRAVTRTNRKLPAYMVVAAKKVPGQWVAELDPRGEALFPEPPEDLVRGWWYVDRDGAITTAFRANARWKNDALREPT